MVLWWIANGRPRRDHPRRPRARGAGPSYRAFEAQRYADGILEHEVLLAGNLDPVPELVTTRDLVAQAATHAGEYVAALKRLV